MLGSAVLAFAYPFELFLLVYAFLGPLHYLTEISWLHDRNYYTQGKYDWLLLLVVSGLISAFFLGILAVGCIGVVSGGEVATLTCFAFVAALFFAFFKKLFIPLLCLFSARLTPFLF